ncbi:MAG: hypothetical protein AAFY56_05255 [Pseudomonadota bacterium]
MASNDIHGGLNILPGGILDKPDIDNTRSDPQQVGRLRGRQIRRDRTTPLLGDRSRSPSPAAPSLTTHQITAQNDARRSMARAINRLVRELLKPEGQIKAGRVASRLADVDLAAKTYQKAFPESDREEKLGDWFDRAIKKQGGNADHVAEMARKFAGKAIVASGEGAQVASNLLAAFEGVSIAPENLKRQASFRDLEQVAMKLETRATAHLDAQRVEPGPELRPDRGRGGPRPIDHRAGQRHLKRLMTSEDLKLKLGTQRDNGTIAKKEVRTFLGFTINTHYKGILDGLDAYKRKLTSSQMRNTEHSRWRQGAELKSMLDDLEAKVDTYATRHPGRATSMRALKTQIANERKLIDDVVGHGSGFARQIRGQKVWEFDENQFPQDTTQELTWANTTSLMAARAAAANRTTDKEAPLPGSQGFASGTINTVDLVQYQDGSTMVFKPDKLSEANVTGLQLDLAGVDLANPRTGARNVATDVLAQHLDMSHLVPHTEFAEHHGRVGTVSALAPGVSLVDHSFKFVPSNQEELAETDKSDLKGQKIEKRSNVFVRSGGKITAEDEISALKKLENNDKDALARLGIENRNGDYYRLGQVVTNPVEVQKLSQLNDEALASAGFRKLETAYVQEFSAKVDLDTSDGEVRRALSDAQWLDAAAFQTDRHPGNLFVDHDDNGQFRSLKLIDNDQAFGKKGRGTALHYHETPDARPRRIGNQPRELPHISAEFKQKLDNVDTNALRRDLQGLLSRDEIDATIDRIDNLKKHAAKLQTDGKVLQKNQWGTSAGAAPKDEHMQYANQIGHYNGRGSTPLPPLLIARAEARLKAPELE